VSEQQNTAKMEQRMTDNWEQTEVIGGKKFTTVAVRYHIRGYVQCRTYCYVDGVKVSRTQFLAERGFAKQGGGS